MNYGDAHNVLICRLHFYWGNPDGPCNSCYSSLFPSRISCSKYNQVSFSGSENWFSTDRSAIDRKPILVHSNFRKQFLRRHATKFLEIWLHDVAIDRTESPILILINVQLQEMRALISHFGNFRTWIFRIYNFRTKWVVIQEKYTANIISWLKCRSNRNTFNCEFVRL